MATNYDEIAAEYKRAKQQLWRLHLEHFTLFKLNYLSFSAIQQIEGGKHQ